MTEDEFDDEFDEPKQFHQFHQFQYKCCEEWSATHDRNSFPLPCLMCHKSVWPYRATKVDDPAIAKKREVAQRYLSESMF